MSHFLIQAIKRSSNEFVNAVYIDEKTGLASFYKTIPATDEETPIPADRIFLIEDSSKSISEEETKLNSIPSSLESSSAESSIESQPETLLSFITELSNNPIENLQKLISNLWNLFKSVPEETLNKIHPETFAHFLKLDDRESPEINNKKVDLLKPIEPALREVGNQANIMLRLLEELFVLPKISLLSEQTTLSNNRVSSEQINALEEKMAQYIASYVNDTQKYIVNLQKLKTLLNSLNSYQLDFSAKANTLIEESKAIKIRDSDWNYPLVHLVKLRKSELSKIFCLINTEFSNVYQHIILSMESYYHFMNTRIMTNRSMLDTLKSEAKTSAELDIQLTLHSTNTSFKDSANTTIVKSISSESVVTESTTLFARRFTNKIQPVMEQPQNRRNKWLLVGALIGALLGLTYTLLVFAPTAAPAIGLSFLVEKLTLPGLITCGPLFGALVGSLIATLAQCACCRNKNTTNRSRIFPESELQKEFNQAEDSKSLLGLTSTASFSAKIKGNANPLVPPTPSSETPYPINTPYYKSLLASPTQSADTTPELTPFQSPATSARGAGNRSTK